MNQALLDKIHQEQFRKDDSKFNVGDSVRVHTKVVEGDKVAFRSVKVGPKVDSLWVVEDGVKAGEQVVVEGLQRIQDGMTVSAKPAPTPPAGNAAPAAVEGK